MLGASGRTQTAWLKSLDSPGGVDLLALLGTAGGRSVQTASLHAQIRDELVDAMDKVQRAEEGAGTVVCTDNTIIRQSPEHDVQAAKLALAIARQGLLKVDERDRGKVASSAEATAAARARRAARTAEVKYEKYTFKVRHVAHLLPRACPPFT